MIPNLRRKNMKKKEYRKKQLFIPVVLSGLFLALFVGSVSAWTPPSNPPYTDPGSPTDLAGTIETGCDCKETNLYQPGDSQGDWPQDSSSQNTLWSWWQNGESWSKSGNATNTYNCHSYIFNGSSHWLLSPSPYIGSNTGCWTLDNNGNVRSNEGHSCTTGYAGKVGRMFLQDNNDAIYGTINFKYKKL
jgi:hypothetical protein